MLIKGQEKKTAEICSATKVITILMMLTQDNGWDSGCIWQEKTAVEGKNVKK